MFMVRRVARFVVRRVARFVARFMVAQFFHRLKY